VLQILHKFYQEIVVKFSAKNSKACGHEKYLKQSMLKSRNLSRINYTSSEAQIFTKYSTHGAQHTVICP
jgi:hypothetical protein